MSDKLVAFWSAESRRVISPNYWGGERILEQRKHLTLGQLMSGTYQVEADANEDGFINFFDIGPFIDLLSSAGP